MKTPARRKKPDFKREKAHGGIVAGIDEAGRGPLAGPVVAAIVILNAKRLPRGVHDSKLLPRPLRETLYDTITATAMTAIGICTVEEIDEHNILRASLLAMKRAHDALPLRPELALIDGNQLPDLPCAMDAIIGGDALCLSIAAASIIAKVTRDRMMAELAHSHPHYGWEHNCGYGTRHHLEALDKHGVTPHHRRSFAPVRHRLTVEAA